MSFSFRRRKRAKLVAAASVAAVVLAGAGSFIAIEASETLSIVAANRTDAAAFTPTYISANRCRSAQTQGSQGCPKNPNGRFVVGVNPRDQGE